MPSIFQSYPLRPTDKGRAAVREPIFRQALAKIALTVKAQEMPYEMLESRCQYLAAITLCPRLAHGSEDDFVAFCRAHWDEIETAWRTVLAPVMRRLDADFGGLCRELGFNLPGGAPMAG
ncbi:MAG: hypothetical protein ACHP8B_10875 [Terriglobales bacterium]